ncbi:MAG: hypothetical protein QW505_03625 [Thermoplasmata archaeon]
MMGNESAPIRYKQEGIPEIESCNETGDTTDLFDFGAPLYVKGSSLDPSGVYNVYIVEDFDSWAFSYTHISDLSIVEGPITIDVDPQGHIEDQPLLIWDSIYAGEYDIWADCLTDGEVGYFDERDALDDLDINDAGFSIIPEMSTILVPIIAVCLIVIVMRTINSGPRKRN